MELDTLRDLYIDELKDLYSAENQILKALPRMIKAASNPELKQAFETHLRQTEGQVQRLDQIFQELDASPRGKKCVGMEGLIEEAKELLSEKPEPEVLDAGLISKAQHVETLLFAFPVVDADSATLQLRWGTTVVPLSIRARSPGAP